MELYYLWLECIKGLGPLGWHLLLEEIGNPYEIYRNRNFLIPQGRITGITAMPLSQMFDKLFDSQFLH